MAINSNRPTNKIIRGNEQSYSQKPGDFDHISGDLSKIKSCVKLTGYVNSTDDFKDQPKIINGASDIISKVFEKKGEHTRAAISSNSLPLGVSVEVDAIFELN